MTEREILERAPLGTAFFDRPAEEVAREILGALLVSSVDGRLTAGRIVEAEAYVGPHDPASHAAARIGRTARNGAMFGPPGIAYVYRIYGVHWCLNVVTGATGDPAAVLIRAVEPLAGLDVMRARRGARTLPSDRDLARGPGRLAEALGITGALDRHTLQQPPLWVATGEPLAPARVGVGPRIGVTRAVDWELRFFEKGSRWVSR